MAVVAEDGVDVVVVVMFFECVVGGGSEGWFGLWLKVF